MEALIIALIVVNGCVIIWLGERGRKEREQLYNRIMARDLNEYNQQTRPPKPPRENFLVKQMRQGYGGVDDENLD